MSLNRKAFLTMIATAEGTAKLGDNGYNVLVGGSLFTGYADHPQQKAVHLHLSTKSNPRQPVDTDPVKILHFLQKTAEAKRLLPCRVRMQ